MKGFLKKLIRGGICLFIPLFLILSCSSDGSGNNNTNTSGRGETSKGTSYRLEYLTSSGDISVSLSNSTLTVTVPDNTAAYTYAWYVNLSQFDSSTSNTFDLSSLTADNTYAILVIVTNSETGVVYTAQYNLTVADGE
ncbi:hypothetical protein [Treponema sp.]|uniref:hypothetical protein n=1 Tax=Treponema sp. TaxID=166 RepID=UPI003891146F